MGDRGRGRGGFGGRGDAGGQHTELSLLGRPVKYSRPAFLPWHRQIAYWNAAHLWVVAASRAAEQCRVLCAVLLLLFSLAMTITH